MPLRRQRAAVGSLQQWDRTRMDGEENNATPCPRTKQSRLSRRQARRGAPSARPRRSFQPSSITKDHEVAIQHGPAQASLFYLLRGTPALSPNREESSSSPAWCRAGGALVSPNASRQLAYPALSSETTPMVSKRMTRWGPSREKSKGSLSFPPHLTPLCHAATALPVGRHNSSTPSASQQYRRSKGASSACSSRLASLGLGSRCVPLHGRSDLRRDVPDRQKPLLDTRGNLASALDGRLWAHHRKLTENMVVLLRMSGSSLDRRGSADDAHASTRMLYSYRHITSSPPHLCRSGKEGDNVARRPGEETARRMRTGKYLLYRSKAVTANIIQTTVAVTASRIPSFLRLSPLLPIQNATGMREFWYYCLACGGSSSSVRLEGRDEFPLQSRSNSTSSPYTLRHG
ncbi:hypothetical protein DCS_07545 [Drechmeria coniospora]|uniref:Uncharacterized protein n=1 Tax=Drechmeria coniospora TaxID=98403 RepID=A0A151GEU2_DRECN|nr:hypothetical protein DCS_07545 [Drechmeria coniospora]KYK55582.1 hypothetical protein DCS_07545 [Drechmeria coniospora]